MTAMNPQRIIVVRALIVDGDGKVLVLRRNPNDEDRPGTVDFPGGGVEPDESFAESARREVEEETGIRVLDSELSLAFASTRYHEARGTIVTRVLYVAHVPAGEEVRLSFEHDAYWWHTVDEVEKLFEGMSWHEAVLFAGKYGLLKK